MEGLKNAREETVKARAELGAVDLRLGEVEGMNEGFGREEETGGCETEEEGWQSARRRDEGE